jgi:hypothetical protein
MFSWLTKRSRTTVNPRNNNMVIEEVVEIRKMSDSSESSDDWVKKIKPETDGEYIKTLETPAHEKYMLLFDKNGEMKHFMFFLYGYYQRTLEEKQKVIDFLNGNSVPLPDELNEYAVVLKGGKKSRKSRKSKKSRKSRKTTKHKK